MTTLAAWFASDDVATSRPASPPKADWPLMGDLATVRAGVPEALILWRRARGETPPVPDHGSSNIRSR